MTHKEKIITVLLSIFILSAFFTGCVKTPAENASKALTDYISVKELSSEQKEIVDLLSVRDKIELYDFSAEQGYTTIDFWVDIYENGELTREHIAGGTMVSDDGNALTGTAAIITSDDPGYQWTFILSMQQGGRSSHTSETIPKYENRGSGYMTIQEPVEIENGKEIVLSATVFDKNGAIKAIGDLQELNATDKLKDYSYAHIIKCKFTR
jgi:hypothetical protein